MSHGHVPSVVLGHDQPAPVRRKNCRGLAYAFHSHMFFHDFRGVSDFSDLTQLMFAKKYLTPENIKNIPPS